MEGKGKDVDDTKDWPKANDVAFIHLLVGKVREGKLQLSTFKKEIWSEINNEMLDTIGVDYVIDRLKGKFNRLRLKYHHFFELIGNTGVKWDVTSNIVNASQKIWEDFFKKNKDFKRFKKQGYAYYELLGEIFNTTTTTGKLQQLSTEDPLSPDEERRLEEEFLSGSTYVDLGGNNSEGICMDLLENMEGVSSCSYNKAIEKFTSAKTEVFIMSISFSSKSSYDLDGEMKEFILIKYVYEYYKAYLPKMPCRTSILSGKAYVMEILYGNPTVCYEMLRMRKHVFLNFCDRLKVDHLLNDEKMISVEEAVAMFLFIIDQNEPQRVVVDRFQHSTEIVSVWFEKVLIAICKLGTRIICPRD
ncbi:hypothetical protein REPUB_Repub04eG0190700 [Reevesia pubescens]